MPLGFLPPGVVLYDPEQLRTFFSHFRLPLLLGLPFAILWGHQFLCSCPLSFSWYRLQVYRFHLFEHVLNSWVHPNVTDCVYRFQFGAISRVTWCYPHSHFLYPASTFCYHQALFGLSWFHLRIVLTFSDSWSNFTKPVFQFLLHLPVLSQHDASELDRYF